ncbi:hypothetical protein FA15DRAFT_660195 [Coprinopsis marcescibilis]|uniref:Uncharacterized protein n=1 Tax=Coprinopsis marcescibilis TaxID=230819 RepID=A0A5C3KG02_COPMA|nr:hypothetical protein FA15DRAFT_660195 [Coprinopsis marcescibilis]
MPLTDVYTKADLARRILNRAPAPIVATRGPAFPHPLRQVFFECDMLIEDDDSAACSFTDSSMSSLPSSMASAYMYNIDIEDFPERPGTPLPPLDLLGEDDDDFVSIPLNLGSGSSYSSHDLPDRPSTPNPSGNTLSDDFVFVSLDSPPSHLSSPYSAPGLPKRPRFRAPLPSNLPDLALTDAEEDVKCDIWLTLKTFRDEVDGVYIQDDSAPFHWLNHMLQDAVKKHGVSVEFSHPGICVVNRWNEIGSCLHLVGVPGKEGDVSMEEFIEVNEDRGVEWMLVGSHGRNLAHVSCEAMYFGNEQEKDVFQRALKGLMVSINFYGRCVSASVFG